MKTRSKVRSTGTSTPVTGDSLEIPNDAAVEKTATSQSTDLPPLHDPLGEISYAKHPKMACYSTVKC